MEIVDSKILQEEEEETKNERREARIHGKGRGDRIRTEERRVKGGNYFQS